MHTQKARAVIIIIDAGTKAGSIELCQVDEAFQNLLNEAPRGATRKGVPRLISTADTSTLSVLPIGKRALMYEAEFTFPD